MNGGRVLSISHSYVVGLNRAMPNALARAGWDVTVVAPPWFPGDLRPLSLEQTPAEAVRLEAVPLRAAGHPHLMAWAPRLRRLLQGNWDIIHVWEEPYVLAGAQVARWRTRGRLVYSTFQNIDKRYSPPFNWFERYAMSRADGWTAFGRSVEGALAARPWYAARPHRVIPPAIDVERFAPDEKARREARGELGFGPDDFVVGFAGRFVPQKGLALLTAALDRMHTRWKALLLGGGPLEHALRRWSDRHAKGQVRILTDVTHRRMARYLNAMDTLAVPSQTTPRWREQFGRVVVEGMSCGTAVVASASGELPHVVAGAGLTVPEADADAWTRVLSRLSEDAELRRSLARMGRARAEAFAPARVAAMHGEFFELLVGDRP